MGGEADLVARHADDADKRLRARRQALDEAGCDALLWAGVVLLTQNRFAMRQDAGDALGGAYDVPDHGAAARQRQIERLRSGRDLDRRHISQLILVADPGFRQCLAVIGAEQHQADAGRRGRHLAAGNGRLLPHAPRLRLARALHRLANLFQARREVGGLGCGDHAIPVPVDRIELLPHGSLIFGQRDRTIAIAIERHRHVLARRVLAPAAAGLIRLLLPRLQYFRSGDDTVAVDVRLERVGDELLELQTDLLLRRLELHAVDMDQLPRPWLHDRRDLVPGDGAVTIEIVGENLGHGARSLLGCGDLAQIVDAFRGHATLVRVAHIERRQQLRSHLRPAHLRPQHSAHLLDDPFRAGKRRRDRASQTQRGRTGEANERSSHLELQHEYARVVPQMD